MKKHLPLVGRTIKSYNIISKIGLDEFLLICSCGEKIIANKQNLCLKNIKTCKCNLNKNIIRKSKFIDGIPSIKHPLYSCWSAMKSRCNSKTNKMYSYYGGRGINVCCEWTLSFEQFVKDIGPRPFKSAELDRIDNNKGYYKDNCKWSTKIENMNNRNVYKNGILMEYNAKLLSIKEYSKLTGIKESCLYGRSRRKRLLQAKPLAN
ncbi:MAG: hypothetical protein JZU65_05545 [Chlorobium sp.]|nr:hypothetical protein [Chlorobium sp.]